MTIQRLTECCAPLSPRNAAAVPKTKRRSETESQTNIQSQIEFGYNKIIRCQESKCQSKRRSNIQYLWLLGATGHIKIYAVISILYPRQSVCCCVRLGFQKKKG